MESIEAIREMNGKHEPDSRRSRCIEDLCERVEELEKENKELRDAIENAPEASQEARSAPTPLTDEALLAFLRERPSTFREVCVRFSVPHCYTPQNPRSDGATDGYTDEATAIGNQLQRLRRARLIRCKSTRWEVR